jgi:dTDP-4-dehydrorhamnose reductase
MNGPRILQFGTAGQLGVEMMAMAKAAAIPLTAVNRKAADFTRPEEVVRVVRQADTDVVVNAVAYTAVDKAESEEALAYAINVDAVGTMAEACAARGLPLIHVSTDYVFDGEKRSPYLETDPTRPLNAYGRTKLAGERALAAANPRHVILRTSWVYSAHGGNFVKTMLRLGCERDRLTVVNDQVGCATSAADIASAILAIAGALHAGKDGFGVFHYTGAGETTWYDFARAVLDGARHWAPVKADLSPIISSQFPTRAQRPRNSRLDCRKIEDVYGIRPVAWRVALGRVLNQLKAQQEAKV